jgi:histidine triad (HIT) family protein
MCSIISPGRRLVQHTANIPRVSDVVCQIVSGELPAAVVVHDDQMVAFLDHRPVFKGHVLIAPVRHVDTMLDLPSELMVPLLSTAQRVAEAVGNALGAEGTFMAVNNVVSQSVPHLHLHVIPRRPKDGLRFFLGPRHPYGSPDESAAVARSIAAALEAG